MSDTDGSVSDTAITDIEKLDKEIAFTQAAFWRVGLGSLVAIVLIFVVCGYLKMPVLNGLFIFLMVAAGAYVALFLAYVNIRVYESDPVIRDKKLQPTKNFLNMFYWLLANLLIGIIALAVQAATFGGKGNSNNKRTNNRPLNRPPNNRLPNRPPNNRFAAAGL